MVCVLTSIGVPAPFTVETIIEIQVPRKITPPNTKGCSGSLIWSSSRFILIFRPKLSHVERILSLSLSVKLQTTATAARTEESREAVTSPDLGRMFCRLVRGKISVLSWF